MPFQKGHRPHNQNKRPVQAPASLTDALKDDSALVQGPAITAGPAEDPPPRFAEKRQRVPVGIRNPMTVNQELDPRFQYRFVREKNARVQQFLDGGYEIVPDKVPVGDPNIAHASGMGSATTIPSGDSEDRVFLMRIPKEFYEEDQAAKQARVYEVEEHLKRKPKQDGLEGDIKINR